MIDWQIQDPKGKSIKEVREIRDKIEQKVKDFTDSVTESESIGGWFQHLWKRIGFFQQIPGICQVRVW